MPRRFGSEIAEPENGSESGFPATATVAPEAPGSAEQDSSPSRDQGGRALGFGQTPARPAENRPADAQTGFVGASSFGGGVASGTPAADLSQDPGQDGLVPQVSLPQGGGALRGVGESFDFNAFTGTAGLSIPIYASPGRAGAPSLSVSYDSGAGNGPFGLGMRLSPPAITRRTDRGLPQYVDRRDSDTFVFSGAEHLVPALEDQGDGTWARPTPRSETDDGEDFEVFTYRPRVESGFSRIERWQAVTGNVSFWRVTSADNVRSTFGRTAQARVADPNASHRIFTWLLERVEDDRGNVTVYEYKAEDLDGIDTGASWESSRAGRPSAQRYLKRVRYGNRILNPVSDADFAFEILFDYGEHGTLPTAGDRSTTGLSLTIGESLSWTTRPDPFSNHRAGFELRTYRRCQRVLMLHRFAALNGGDPTVVASTDFYYDDDLVGAKLIAATHRGYERTAADVYDAQAVPPLELEYAGRELGGSASTVDPDSLRDLGMGLDADRLQMVDLDGEGVSGLLYSTSGGWYYKRSRGGGRFEAAVRQRSLPSPSAVAAPRLLDLDGDGRLSMVAFAGTPGQYERTEDGDWESHQTFRHRPNERVDDPRSRLVDLTGDGLADLLVDRGDTLAFYASQGHRGYAEPIMIRKLAEGREQPERIYSDPRIALFFADMTGDGLSDLVVVRNGSVAYWPNQGYGRFGLRIDMGGLSPLDGFDQFEAQRIRLGDVDGSGTSDLVYFDGEGARVWINASGNTYLPPEQIDGFPPVDNVSHADLADITGTGLADLVWSSSLASHAQRQIRFVELRPDGKPYLLQGIRNNMGGERRLSYAPSTRFYLQAREEGRPWKTRLPFPVYVVDRVEQFDHITGHRYVSTYAYHHGYFDGPEREFRGFGLVEQTDTESFEHAGEPGLFPTGHRVEDDMLHVPPVRTRTWFHTGAFLGVAGEPNLFDDEYWPGDPDLHGSLAHRMPDTRSAIEQREALRALRGRVLHTEVYALDDTGELPHPGELAEPPRTEANPYAVTTARYVVRREQPRGGNPFGVFFVHSEEERSIAYERDATDPRLTQSLTLEVDEFGVPTRTASLAYPRRTVTVGAGGATVADLTDEQTTALATLSESDVVHDNASASVFRLAVPIEQRAYEFRGLSLDPLAPTNAEALRGQVTAATRVDFETPASGSVDLRLLSRRQARYYADDLSGPLALGQVGTRALLHDQQAQAFTAAHVTAVLSAGATGENLDDILLEGEYLLRDNAWWIRSGRAIPDPARFYLPSQVLDPFGNATTIEYDPDVMAVTAVTDALTNRVEAVTDYRVLSPWRTIDPNNNVSEVEFDTLGQVVAVASIGKVALNEGDSLADPTATFEYDLFSYMDTAANDRPVPVWTRARTREVHQDPTTRFIEAVNYSSGTGNGVQTKVRVEAGLAPERDAQGELVFDGSGELQRVFASDRWVGNGRVIRNNKGLPIKQYEPFFSSTDGFETEPELVEMGVTPLLHYDPLGRLIRTDLPDGTLARVDFTPWRQVSHDPGDTVLESAWHAREIAEPLGSPRRRAAELSEAYANTPSVTHLDVLGRAFLTDAHHVNGSVDEHHLTRAEMDIQGNPLRVEDARGNDAETRVFAMLGQSLLVDSVDAGERRALADIGGRPLRSWNARGFIDSAQYDALNRPTHQFVREGAGTRQLVSRIFYGEGLSNAVDLNMRGQAYRTWDSAGVTTQNEFDFEGNLLSSTRRLPQDFTSTPDWNALDQVIDPTDLSQLDTAAETLLESPIASQVYTISTTWDALGRPVTQTTPDASVMTWTYNQAGLLEEVEGTVHGTTTTFVQNVDYDVRGRRERIDYGNNTFTTYEYDPLSLRLTRLRTERIVNNPAILQELQYTYDAVGNIAEIFDGAQQTVYFNNTVIEPRQQFVYDSLYRLIEATGREHNSIVQPTHADLPPGPQPGDPTAIRTYLEQYTYDEVGNIEELHHDGGSGGTFTRTYNYAANGNQLLSTSVPGAPGTTVPYGYDPQGNMNAMPHLPTIDWDFADRMRHCDLDGGGDVYFVYDGAGNRVCKARVAIGGAIRERIYIGPYEVYRERSSSGSTTATLERQTIHVSDDTGRICMAETRTIGTSGPANVNRYQYANHLGSAQLEASQTGDVISYEEFHPYGTSAYRAADSLLGDSPSRYRYTGQERDEETGLGHHGARYYASWLGRWTATDPIGLGDGVNRYQYSRGNPATFGDPGGQRTEGAVLDELFAKQAELLAAAIGGENVSEELETVGSEIAEEAGRRTATAHEQPQPTQLELLGAELDQAAAKKKQARIKALGELYERQAHPGAHRPENIPDVHGDYLSTPDGPLYTSYAPGSGGDILEYYDQGGNFLGTKERGLQPPDVDPYDFIPVGGPASGAGRRILGEAGEAVGRAFLRRGTQEVGETATRRAAGGGIGSGAANGRSGSVFVNPSGGTPLPKEALAANRQVNCVNCTVATDATVAGRPASALPQSEPLPTVADLLKAHGKVPADATVLHSPAEVVRHLQAAPPGSRAVIAGSESIFGGEGHAWNAVRERSGVRFLDGQSTNGGASWTFGEYWVFFTHVGGP